MSEAIELIKKIRKSKRRQIIAKAKKKSLAFASLLLASGLYSCGETETEQQDRILTELECPVILIAKTDKGTAYHKFVVRDAQGRIRTFAAGSGDGYKLPNAIVDSRNVGDTLKPCTNDK